MAKVPPKLPLSITLDTISLTGFTRDSSGGTTPIAQYDGSPLYCHVVETAPGSNQVNIAFDLTGPSTFTSQIGLVSSITVAVDSSGTVLTFNPAGAVYAGVPLGYYLQLADDLSTATLSIEQPRAVQAKGDGSLGLIVLGVSVTGAGTPRGYFVDVPVGPNFGTVDAITVYWSDGGSLAGPIGGGMVPANGP
jgi:hypothetical protein